MINLLQVRENIERAGGPSSSPVLLVAVSKRQPIEAIRGAYALGQRDFGENYVQELLEKAKADGELARECPEIRWHFIGTLQSNKIAALIRGVPNLKSIQSIDSLGKLEMCMKLAPKEVDLFIQVNLSGEESKHGFRSVNDVVEAFQIGKDRLSGLMLIGAVGESERDFSAMLELKRALTAQLGNDYCCCRRLSMGMSGDYELAVKMGSSVVRVGTAIFGERGE